MTLGMAGRAFFIRALHLAAADRAQNDRFLRRWSRHRKIIAGDDRSLSGQGGETRHEVHMPRSMGAVQYENQARWRAETKAGLFRPITVSARSADLIRPRTRAALSYCALWRASHRPQLCEGPGKALNVPAPRVWVRNTIWPPSAASLGNVYDPRLDRPDRRIP